MVDVIVEKLAGPASFVFGALAALVVAVAVSTYLHPGKWGVTDQRLRGRIAFASRFVLRGFLLWLLPFGIGIVFTFSVAIWLGERFDRLPHPVVVLIALYVSTSLLAMWLIRKAFPRYGQGTGANQGPGR